MNLKDTKSAYFSGQISKPDYIDAMYLQHQNLFNYADFLEDTDIAKIEITDKSVVMTSRSTKVKICCDRQDKRLAPFEILNFNFYEKTDSDMILNLLANLVRQKSEKEVIFFDIGANVGWYTINLAKMFENVKFLAFEPIPMTFEKLKSNVEMNLVNVDLHNFGFSNQEKELTFYYYPEGSGNASAANLSESVSVQNISCPVKKLDNFTVENSLNVDFIKCDVEGAELFVYQGGIDTLKKNKPIIFTEMLRKWSAKFDYHPNDIINLLREIGYRCFTVKEDKLSEFVEMNEHTKETNFFFLNSLHHAALIESFLLTT
jgi:FkbM family methyltransferase